MTTSTSTTTRHASAAWAGFWSAVRRLAAWADQQELAKQIKEAA